MKTNEYKPAPAMFFGGAVYVGVVLAMSTLFISFVLTAFPPNAYFSRMVMTVSGVLIGLSAIAFPVALHTWTVEKWHRIVATVLYYGEILIMAVNSIVSFMTLLSTYTGYVVPEWAKLYEPFAIASIVYTLAAWGTIFLLDPSHKRTQKEREADEKLYDRVAEKRLEYVESIEGENVIASIVANDIQTRYDPEKFKRERKHFGGAIPAPAPFVKKEQEVMQVTQPAATSRPLTYHPQGFEVARGEEAAPGAGGERARSTDLKISGSEFTFELPYSVWFVCRDLPESRIYHHGKVAQLIAGEYLIDRRGILETSSGHYPFGTLTQSEIAEIRAGRLPACFLREKPYEAPAPRSKFDHAARDEAAVFEVMDSGNCSCPTEYFADNPSADVKARVRHKGYPECWNNGVRHIEARTSETCEKCAFFTGARPSGG